MPRGDEDFAEYVANRPTQPPAILYKYMPAASAEKVLGQGLLFTRSPLLFSDVFDVSHHPLWQIETSEYLQAEARVLRKAILGDEPPPIDANPQFVEVLEQLRRSLVGLDSSRREREFAKIWRRDASSWQESWTLGIARFHHLRCRLRILCLTEDSLNPVMWAHYGDEHRGVCLGFDRVLLEESWKRPVERVCYSDSLPFYLDPIKWAMSMIYGCPTPEPTEDAIRFALVKRTEFSYEAEWRFVSIAEIGDLNREGRVQLPPGCVREVLVGARGIKELVKKLCGGSRLVTDATAIHEVELDPISRSLTVPYKSR